MYPVDLPAVDDTDLRSASEQYLSSLESKPLNNEWFQSSQTSKVAITANNVSWLQVFEDDRSECTLLALHPPDHPTQGLELHTCIDTYTHKDICTETPSDSLSSTFQWWLYTFMGNGGV
ncbi:hypothetical protein PAMP_019342 [Pampus punctatissimus]